MKRVGYLYETICDIEVIKTAIRKASKGKTTRPYIVKILNHIDYYAAKLKEMLETDTVVLSPNSQCEIYDPSCKKTRTITVPKFFPDQVIHWLLVIALQPVMEKGMYQYCCGSVPNRGGIAAKRFIERAIKDTKVRYVAKLDISKFFSNVKPRILLNMLSRKVKDKRILELTEKVLINGGNGLPIGYYTSQWFSNFYLEGLDHYIKEQLGIRHYVRYVDDMVLLDTNKRKMRKAIAAIEMYLQNIGLKLKDNWQLWRIHSRPIDFVGYRFYKDKTLLRKKIFYKLNRRVRKVKKTGYITPHQAMSLLSLLGWLSHINSRNWYKQNIQPYAPKAKLKRIVSNYSKKYNL